MLAGDGSRIVCMNFTVRALHGVTCGSVFSWLHMWMMWWSSMMGDNGQRYAPTIRHKTVCQTKAPMWYCSSWKGAVRKRESNRKTWLQRNTPQNSAGQAQTSRLWSHKRNDHYVQNATWMNVGCTHHHVLFCLELFGKEALGNDFQLQWWRADKVCVDRKTTHQTS